MSCLAFCVCSNNTYLFARLTNSSRVIITIKIMIKLIGIGKRFIESEKLLSAFEAGLITAISTTMVENRSPIKSKSLSFKGTFP